MKIKELVDLRVWNGLQISVFRKYGIQNNIPLLQKIAKHLAEIEITLNTDTTNNTILLEELVKERMDDTTVNDLELEINNNDNVFEIVSIYKKACSEIPAKECSIEDFKNHLISKVELLKEFDTDQLKETVCNIVSHLYIH